MQLNLSVMAWEDSEGNEVNLPATASEHLKVVSVKGDHSPVIRKRRAPGSKNVCPIHVLLSAASHANRPSHSR